MAPNSLLQPFEISIQPYLRTLQSRHDVSWSAMLFTPLGQEALDGNLGTGEFFVGR
jgi:hypothetical protein